MIESRHTVVANETIQSHDLITNQPVRSYLDKSLVAGKKPALEFAGLYPKNEEHSFFIADRYDSLPLSSRTPEEVMEDYETELAFQASNSRSMTRRRPQRYESAFVVGMLDDYADRKQELNKRVANLALSHLRFMDASSKLRD